MIFNQEPDLIRIIQENRAKRAVWTLYISIVATFALGFLILAVRLP